MSDTFSKFVDLKENQKILKNLKADLSRSGRSTKHIINTCNLHKFLTLNRIKSLLSGSIRYFPIEEYTSINNALKNLPDKVDHSRERPLMEGYVSITPEIKDEIRMLINKTGIGAIEAVRVLGIKDLNPNSIGQWLKGQCASAHQEKLEKLLEGWRKLPENKYQEVTPELSSFLKKEIERTGVGAMAILRGNKIAKEMGLTSGKIERLINLSRKKIRSNELEIIKELWREVPNKSKNTPNTLKRGRVVITQSFRNKILSEIERTGCGASKVLRGNKEARDIGLNSKIIQSWIRDEKNGVSRIKSANKEHIELAKELWAKLPNKEDVKPKKQVSVYIKTKEKHRNSLLED